MARSIDQTRIKPTIGEAGQLEKARASQKLSHAEPPQDRLSVLIVLYNQRRLEEVVRQATAMTAEFPNAVILYNILGAAYAALRNPDGAIASLSKALQIKPDFAEAHNNLGIALKDQGHLKEAIASFGKALQIKPDFAEAHNNLGIALKDEGRLEEAIASFSNALQIKADNAEAHSNLGIALKDQGRLEEAIASFSKALQVKPDFAQAHNNLGIVLKDQGRLEEAIASFGKALQIKPDFAQVHNNLGLALEGQGRMEAAIASFGKALQIEPDFAEAHSNLGLELQGQGHLEAAIASFRKALQIKPDFAQAHNNLGIALKDQGRLEEALASFGKALQIKPDYAEVHNNLGLVLESQGRMEEALTSFGKALQIKPDYAEAHSNLCELFEIQNNIGEFESTLEKAILNCGEDNSEILFSLAQLANRKNQFEDAVGYLENVQVERIRPSLRSSYFSLLGKICDQLGRFEEAFCAFGRQNELTRATIGAKKFNANGYLNSILSRKEDWTTEVKPVWANPMIGMKQVSPTFLVGFPRSGTTLLDTILRSHREISVVEEKPMVGAMSKAFRQGHTIQIFNELSEADVLSLRDVYFRELKMFLDRSDDGKLIVDKHPLNICDIGLIHRVFPDAKFILALRHPCDCVLSCFMQTFKLSDAMANFLSLDQSAKLYAAVMELWSTYRQKLDFDVHVVKYEDLVQDLEGTCIPLVKFLQLEWDDNLHNYQKTALDRGRINTASYQQVIQPLYSQAIGRWTNYREQMQPVLPVLQPWIEAFGY